MATRLGDEDGDFGILEDGLQAFGNCGLGLVDGEAGDAQAAWDGARAEVDAAIEFARSSPYPEPVDALAGVFA